MSDDVLGAAPDTPEDPEIVAAAVRRFLTERHVPGVVVPWSWFYQALQLPNPEGLNDIASYKRWQLRFLTLRQALEKELLTRHMVAFDTVIGEGMKFVSPNEQTTWAQTELQAEIRRTMSKGSARLRHVNIAMLSPPERAQNVDAIASFASLRAMLRSQLRQFDQLNGKGP
jgi:hypothetical protein